MLVPLIEKVLKLGKCHILNREDFLAHSKLRCFFQGNQYFIIICTLFSLRCLILIINQFRGDVSLPLSMDSLDHAVGLKYLRRKSSKV